MSSPVTIIRAYVIENKINGKRYVGVTVKEPPEVRWSEHIARAKRGDRQHYLANAIRKHGADKFTFTVIAEAYSVPEAIRLERGLIAQYGTFWPNGYNLTNGGEGNVGFVTSEATKAKQSAAAEQRMSDPEFRARWDAGIAKRSADPEKKRRQADSMRTPEHRALVSKITTERMADPATRARISAAVKAVFSTPEKRAERRANRLTDWAKPEYQEKHAATMAEVGPGATVTRLDHYNDPEFRRRMSDVQKVVWEDPEYRAARSAEQRERLNNPETKRRMSESRKRIVAEKKAQAHADRWPMSFGDMRHRRAAQITEFRELIPQPTFSYGG